MHGQVEPVMFVVTEVGETLGGFPPTLVKVIVIDAVAVETNCGERLFEEPLCVITIVNCGVTSCCGAGEFVGVTGGGATAPPPPPPQAASASVAPSARTLCIKPLSLIDRTLIGGSRC